MRLLIATVLAVSAASGLQAQEKPSPAAQKSITGSWKLDPAHSDSLTVDVLASLGSQRALGGGGGGRSAGGGSGGGGGGRRSGRNAAPAMPTDTTSARPVEERPSRPADPRLAMLISDANLVPQIAIAANDSTISMTTPGGQSTTWKTDGRKRQQAQMDGSLVETFGGWKDDELTLTRGIPGTGTLKREFKTGKEGTVLELKASFEVGGRKVEKKFIYTRE